MTKKQFDNQIFTKGMLAVTLDNTSYTIEGVHFRKREVEVKVHPLFGNATISYKKIKEIT